MAEIVGTITNLSDFLSKTQVCLSVKPNDPQQQIIRCLFLTKYMELVLILLSKIFRAGSLRIDIASG